MSADIKSLILLAATLVVGFALGLFADATLVRGRRESLRDIQRPPGFVAHMEDVIRPHSDAQRDSIRTILERQAARNDTIMRATRGHLRARARLDGDGAVADARRGPARAAGARDRARAAAVRARRSRVWPRWTAVRRAARWPAWRATTRWAAAELSAIGDGPQSNSSYGETSLTSQIFVASPPFA